MVTLGSLSANILLPDEVAARVQRLTSDFPSLLQEPGFEKRIVRAQSMAVRGCIYEISPGKFRVQSESNPDGFYYVDTTKKTCTCPDAGKHPERRCKHRLAAALYVGWFSQEKAPKAPELRKDYIGYIIHPKFPRLPMLQVKIIAVDAPANLVTIRILTQDPATGQPWRVFFAPGSEDGFSSVASVTPQDLREHYSFRPATEEELISGIF